MTPCERQCSSRAIWHYTTVCRRPAVGRVGLPGLVPRAERRRASFRVRDDFVRYRPASYRHPADLRGAKLRLVERGAYRTYSLLEPLKLAIQRAARGPAG